MGYRAVTQADADSLRRAPVGLIVNRVLPNTPAAKAGIQAGDVIRRINADSIRDETHFKSLLRTVYAGDAVTLSVIRDGLPRKILVVSESLPRETCDSLDVEYTSFPIKNVRLRAVLVSPKHSGHKKLPALLIVSALGSPQLIGTPFYSMTRNLAYAAAAAGFRVLRFELRGCGDSEGEDYREADFDAEVGDNLAALDWLAGRNDVLSECVFVFGHSTGGMEAALLAGRRDLAGLIVSCTVGRTCFERMAETVRLQDEFAGRSAGEIEESVRRILLFATAIARGDSLPDILRSQPAFSEFVNSSGRIMDDRTPAFWRQQLNLNLAETYEHVGEPTLVVYGASDFITSKACHERIRETLSASGNPDVELRVIPTMDHTYAFAEDKKTSFFNYRKRDFRENPDGVKTVVDWLVRHAGR